MALAPSGQVASPQLVPSVVAPVMEALLIRRVDGSEWVRETLFETVIPPLSGATAAQRFVF